MPPGRPKKLVKLSTEEREKLETMARRPKSAQAMALRARIVLGSDEGMSNAAIAARLRLTAATVGKWRRRFLESRLEGLLDEPRVGAPRKITDRQIEEVVTKTLESMPANGTHWSTRGMAEAMDLSQNSIVRIWHAFGLQPHRLENFKFSKDPQFVEKVRDIVGLYLNPPDRAIILCIDEKSQVQALDRTQPLLPLAPGQAERHPHDYGRNGTTSLFAALNGAAGAVIGECYRRHRHQEFLRFLKLVDSTITKAPGVEIHLVMDNYGTHKTPAVKRWLLRHPEYHLHFTPTSGSWLNQVERFFAEITEKQIRRGAFRSVKALEEAIKEYLKHHNHDPKPFVWTADADLILSRVEGVCKRTPVSGH